MMDNVEDGYSLMKRKRVGERKRKITAICAVETSEQ